MSTLKKYDDERSLMETPQRFGIWPTLWFWTGPNQLRVAWILIPIEAILGGVLNLFDLSLLTMMVCGFLGGLLSLGIAERWLRHKVEERRALSAKMERQQLAEGEIEIDVG